MSIIKAKFDESACIINRLRLKWNGEVQQMNLAKRMAYLKKRDGLTTEMLSQRSGVATGTLNKLLNGATRRPALETCGAGVRRACALFYRCGCFGH